MNILLLVVIGLFAGLAAGFFGIGGGVVIVPALTLLLGFGQHQAVGTSLAVLLPPVGAAAVYEYYKNGNVDLKAAVVIALTLFIGGWFGAKVANGLSDATLKISFGVFLICLGIYTVHKGLR